MARFEVKETYRLLTRALMAVAAALTLLAVAPATKVHAGDNPSPVTCIGGILSGPECLCRESTVKVKTGRHAFRCVMGNLTTVAPHRPFVHPGEGRPGMFIRPAPTFGGPGGMRPFNRESSLPQRPFMR